MPIGRRRCFANRLLTLPLRALRVLRGEPIWPNDYPCRRTTKFTTKDAKSTKHGVRRSLPSREPQTAERRNRGPRGGAGTRNGDGESAGINRLGIGNERVLQGRNSQSLWPRTVRCRWQHRGCSIGERKRRPAIELRNHQFRVPILSCQGEGEIVNTVNGKVADGRGGVRGTCACVDIPSTRTGRSHWFLRCTVAKHSAGERSVNVTDGTADMNANGKSDESIVPMTLANKDSAELCAESGEGSVSTKRNVGQTALSRTQSRIEYKLRGLHGVREIHARLKVGAV